MKVRSLTFLVISLMVSNAATAATQIENTLGKQKIGVVSATGAFDLHDLAIKLNNKATKDGATYFKIIAAGGQNKLFGDADIYK